MPHGRARRSDQSGALYRGEGPGPGEPDGPGGARVRAGSLRRQRASARRDGGVAQRFECDRRRARIDTGRRFPCARAGAVGRDRRADQGHGGAGRGRWRGGSGRGGRQRQRRSRPEGEVLQGRHLRRVRRALPRPAGRHRRGRRPAAIRAARVSIRPRSRRRDARRAGLRGRAPGRDRGTGELQARHPGDGRGADDAVLRAVPSFQGPRPGSVQHPQSAVDLRTGDGAPVALFGVGRLLQRRHQRRIPARLLVRRARRDRRAAVADHLAVGAGGTHARRGRDRAAAALRQRAAARVADRPAAHPDLAGPARRCDG